MVKKLDRQFPSKETSLGLVVYRSPDGLTPADKAKIIADAKRSRRSRPRSR